MPKVIQVRNFYAITDEEWRVLNAVETGMRNHEFVQLDMLHDYAGINYGGKSFIKILRSSLVPHRLIAFKNNGYRLTNLGYDFLALHAFIKSGTVLDLSNFQLFATGKESDLYVCKAGLKSQEEFEINMDFPIVLKFHRLGRTSFKQVKNKREYKTGNSTSWLYMNRISATREYCTMEALYKADLPVPTPLGHNRGAVAMKYVNSCPLFKFSKEVLENGAALFLYEQGKELLIRMAKLGLVHGDFNEFNLLVEVAGFDYLSGTEQIREESGKNMKSEEEQESEEENDSEEETNSEVENESEEENESDNCEDNENRDCHYLNQDVSTFKLHMIDFPQAISRNNKIAQEIYARDRHGLVSFFRKFTQIDESDLPPANVDDIERIDFLDVKLKAPGYPRNDDKYTKDVIGQLENESEKPVKEISFNDIKKKVLKEKSKTVRKERIYKQQRNIKKKECRKDLKADMFE